MSTTFLEANNIKIYVVLWDFTKGRNLRIKSATQVANIEGGGSSAISGNAHIKTAFFMASLKLHSYAISSIFWLT